MIGACSASVSYLIDKARAVSLRKWLGGAKPRIPLVGPMKRLFRTAVVVLPRATICYVAKRVYHLQADEIAEGIKATVRCSSIGIGERLRTGRVQTISQPSRVRA